MRFNIFKPIRIIGEAFVIVVGAVVIGFILSFYDFRQDLDCSEHFLDGRG